MFFALYAISAGLAACLVLLSLKGLIQKARQFQSGTGANPWLIAAIVTGGVFCAIFLPIINTLLVVYWWVEVRHQ